MKLEGEQRIEAGRAAVWHGLNDPDVLRRSIPGCESLVSDGDNRFKAVVAIKVGPIGARFNGTVELSDLDPPSGYTLSGEGQGGVAGSAKGHARVRLEADGAATRLIYSVEAQVGGRMAQLGGAIIDATARQLAGRFFARFAEEVGTDQTAGGVAGIATAAAPAPDAGSPAPSGAMSGGEPAHAGRPLAPLVIALLAAYGLGVFQARADLFGTDSLVVMALLAIVAIAARMTGRPRTPGGSR